jgi:hypothetical protein
VTSLAATSDLEVRTGQTFDYGQAEAVLLDVSARVRNYTGCDFAQHTSTVTVDVCGGVATVPHGPVISITSVTVDGTALTVDVDYTWESGRKIDVPGVYGEAVIVEVWGYADVPADVVAVVCQMAARALGSPSTDAGITSESLGSYSVTQGSAAGSGPLGMLPDERETLDVYRRPTVAKRPIVSTPWIS